MFLCFPPYSDGGFLEHRSQDPPNNKDVFNNAVPAKKGPYLNVDDDSAPGSVPSSVPSTLPTQMYELPLYNEYVVSAPPFLYVIIVMH